MNEPEKLVKRSDAIKLFLSGMGDGENIDGNEDYSVAISDPVDSQRAQNALELIKDFGNMIKQREFHPAAQLAVSNQILTSLHSFRRITGNGYKLVVKNAPKIGLKNDPNIGLKNRVSQVKNEMW